MQTTTEKTVREIALENPAAIRIFEFLGIDYCCGGQRPLSEACAHAAVDYDRVMGLLEQADTTPGAAADEGWAGKPLGALIAHIVETHHGYVRRETPRIHGLLAKVGAKHAVRCPELVRIERLFQALAQELATHMFKEENVLFPYIENMERAVEAGEAAPAAFFGTVDRPISAMMADHDDAGALLAQIRTLSNGYQTPEGACPTFIALYRALAEFEADLHQHIHLENNALFPRAMKMQAGR